MDFREEVDRIKKKDLVKEKSGGFLGPVDAKADGISLPG